MDSPVVLVLDDEPGIMLLCKRLLTRAGFSVLAFTEPRLAIAELERQHADLLLVDIRMPELDGFDVIARAQHIQPDLAVLVMTGFGTVETAIRALRQGVDGLLLKPFEQGEELIAAARQALADNQKKRDAARIQTLRPLFTVTESLFSETHPARLTELVLSAICEHLHCAHAALYRFDAERREFMLEAARGIAPFESQDGLMDTFIEQVSALNSPLLVNANGPGQADQRSELTRRGLAGVIFVPVTRLAGHSLLFAGRDSAESPFSEADLEMFQILARQVAIAMENARLYAELRDYVRRVEDSQQALLQAEKMAAAGRLTASIAHEINNPLQSVQNCIHLAGREDLPIEKRQEYFGLARSELDRLQTTVQRMLDFYRPNAVSPQAVNVGVLISLVLRLMAKQLEERQVTVNLQVASNLPELEVVPSQIQQVFINLILNAYDAMPDGGELTVSAQAVRGGMEILVCDTGPGVPEEARRNIFEPFVSTKQGGTGLGLTVSYNIVTAHGGTLELLSGNGPGACFRVYLPFGGVK
jgi:signal transduction histidine kinase/FixJ family two-component response regulator